MKKILLAIMLLFATNITTMLGGDVILNPTSSHEQGKKPKMPAAPIHADQDGFTITFGEGCIGCPITLIDEDENIVYTTVVNEEGIVELPGSLSGTFELQLERGGITFVGVIEL